MRRRTFIGAMGATALAGCSGDDAKKNKIVFQTDWRAEVEHGGFYQALATGEFKKRGLDVTIRAGGPGVNVPALLTAGQADFGIGSNSFIVMNLVREAIPVKAIAAFFQKDPQILMIHPDPQVRSIADLKGRPFLLADASKESFWAWLKAKYGFTDAQVRKYNYNLGPFLEDARAVQQGYLTSEPMTVEREGHFKPRVFLLADEGYPSYAGMVLCPDKLLRERPEIARKFIDACIAGWSSYLDEDPKPGDDLILKENPEMSRELLDQGRSKLLSYAVVEGGDAVTWGIGAMTHDRWSEFFKAGVKQGLYPADMPYKQGYTLGLVDRGPPN